MDAATDVLSFPGGATPEGRHLGDMVVAVPTARRQAAAAGHPVERELRSLLLHGVLHCLGHDHETDDGDMERLERRLRRRWSRRRRAAVSGPGSPWLWGLARRPGAGAHPPPSSARRAARAQRPDPPPPLGRRRRAAGCVALSDAPVRFAVFRYPAQLAGQLVPVGLFVALAELLASLAGVRAVGRWRRWWRLVAACEAEQPAAGRPRRRGGAAPLHPPLPRRLRRAVAAGGAAGAAGAGRRPRRWREDDDEDDLSDEEIEAFIDVGTREGILEPEQGEWLWSIVDFGDTPVRSVMTPRIDMVCAAVESDLEDLAERFLESGHSRIPLYQDSIDDVVGILHIRDLLRGLRSALRRAPAN